MQNLTYKQHKQVGIITMNYDAKRNALSKNLCQEIIMQLSEIDKQKTRVVILTANANAKVWSAGHDIRDFKTNGEDPINYTSYFSQLLRAVTDYPLPIIAMINGSVWGGACELAISCDILIGTSKATFAITPAKLGFAYNLSGLQRYLNILSSNVIKELFFTAETISAERALQIGLLNHLVEEQELEDYCLAMAEQIAANALQSISIVKKQLNILQGVHRVSTETIETNDAERAEIHAGRDFEEGLDAFFAKRVPIFTESVK